MLAEVKSSHRDSVDYTLNKNACPKVSSAGDVEEAENKARRCGDESATRPTVKGVESIPNYDGFLVRRQTFPEFESYRFRTLAFQP